MGQKTSQLLHMLYKDHVFLRFLGSNEWHQHRSDIWRCPSLLAPIFFPWSHRLAQIECKLLTLRTYHHSNMQWMVCLRKRYVQVHCFWKIHSYQNTVQQLVLTRLCLLQILYKDLPFLLPLEYLSLWTGSHYPMVQLSLSAPITLLLQYQ